MNNINEMSKSEKRINIIQKQSSADRIRASELAAKELADPVLRLHKIGLVSLLAAMTVICAALGSASYFGYITKLYPPQDVTLLTSLLSAALLAAFFGFFAAKKAKWRRKITERENSEPDSTQIVGFGEKDILLRTACSRTSFEYGEIKCCTCCGDGLFIAFKTRQYIYMPWRFFSEEAAKGATSRLAAALGSRHVSRETVALHAACEPVSPDADFVIEGEAKRRVEYVAGKSDIFHFLFRGRAVKHRGILLLCVVLALSSAAVNAVERDVAGLLNESLPLFGVLLAVALMHVLSVDRAARRVYKKYPGASSISFFENCALVDYMNGDWLILPYADSMQLGEDGRNCIVFSKRYAVLVPLRYIGEELHDIIEMMEEAQKMQEGAAE